MRGLIEFMTIFDWITPTVGFFEDVINDPTPLQTNSWTFFIPYDESLSSGWNAAMIERMLSQYGIKHWGGQITNGRFFFSVPKNQARWAEYLITGQGIPVDPLSLGAPAPGKNAGSNRRKSGSHRRGDLLDQFDALMGKLLG